MSVKSLKLDSKSDKITINTIMYTNFIETSEDFSKISIFWIRDSVFNFSKIS